MTKRILQWTVVFLVGLGAGLGIRHGGRSVKAPEAAVEALVAKVDTMLRLRTGKPEVFLRQFEATLPEEAARVQALGDRGSVRHALAKVREYYEVTEQSMPERVAELMESLPPSGATTPEALALAIEASTLSQVGDRIPLETLRSVAGETLELKGKVVLLDFFATWCPSCLAAMPHLEADIWQRWKGEDFLLLGVGREHTEEELKAWRPKTPVSYPLVADPGREVFSWFASRLIPRCVLVGRDGRIRYQSGGFSANEHARLVMAVEQELRRGEE